MRGVISAGYDFHISQNSVKCPSSIRDLGVLKFDEFQIQTEPVCFHRLE